MAIFGKYTAFPHGSVQPQKLREGDLVLIDDGCSVEGYQSDITRTVIFGKPTQRQRDIWELERKAQDAALAAAKPGTTCESVDAAARKVITDYGFGPGYKVPGPAASHRPRDRPGRARVAVSGTRQQAVARARNVLQRRADHRHLRRIRRAPGRLHVHHRGRRPHVHQAEPGHRSAVRVGHMPQNNDTADATYRARIEKLREAMKEFGLAAVVIEPGPAMVYLTGVRWGRSERTFALVVPLKGDLVSCCPVSRRCGRAS